jgi:hypothetical protein
MKDSHDHRPGSAEPSAAANLYAELVEILLKFDGVSLGSRRGFGMGGLTVNGKLFATLRGSSLLLKLPAGQVASLIAAGRGQMFDAGKGRPMREWVTVDLADGANWPALARDALEFVRGGA